MTRSFKPPANGASRRAGQALTLALAAFAGIGCAGCDAAGPGDDARAAADPRQGQRLLAQYQCGSCHAIPGVAASRGLQGPSLAAFGRRSYIAGRIPNNADTLARWIAMPAALVPDTTMPSMGVSPAEARAMAAYLETLR
jgi:cytochrome c1